MRSSAVMSQCTSSFLCLSKSPRIACHPIEKRPGERTQCHCRCSSREIEIQTVTVESTASRVPTWLRAAAFLAFTGTHRASISTSTHSRRYRWLRSRCTWTRRCALSWRNRRALDRFAVSHRFAARPIPTLPITCMAAPPIILGVGLSLSMQCRSIHRRSDETCFGLALLGVTAHREQRVACRDRLRRKIIVTRPFDRV